MIILIPILLVTIAFLGWRALSLSLDIQFLISQLESMYEIIQRQHQELRELGSKKRVSFDHAITDLIRLAVHDQTPPDEARNAAMQAAKRIFFQLKDK